MIVLGRSGSSDVAKNADSGSGIEALAKAYENKGDVAPRVTTAGGAADPLEDVADKPDEDGFYPMRWPEPGETNYRTKETELESAEGLPENHVLSVGLGDQLDRFTFRPDEWRTLYVTLVLRCVDHLPSSNVVGAGFVKLNEVLNGRGEKIPARVFISFDETEQIKTFDTIGGTVFSTGKSANLVFGKCHIQVPSTETEPLKKISGSFVIMTGRKVKQFEIADVPTTFRIPTTDPDLVQAGFNLKFEQEYGDQMVRVSVKQGYSISKLNAFSEQGYNVESVEGTSETNQLLKSYFSAKSDGRTFPTTYGFRAELWTDLQQTTIPFAFENVTIPAKGEKIED